MATETTNRTPETQRVTVNADNAPLLTVLRSIARQAGLVPVFNVSIIPAATHITLHVHDVAAPDAFQQALRGTGLVADVQVGGNVTVIRDGNFTTTNGTIVGTVTDAKTKLPLRGAKIGIDGTDRVTETADGGTFRLTGISAGSHALTAKLLGYMKMTRTVEVRDDAATTVNMALESSATPLEQVVVTGTVVQTELKAVPNAMTVITAKQLEERGITHIDQLFRGDIPGLFALNQGSNTLLNEVTMFSRGATALSAASAGTTEGLNNATYTNPIKTYVDGVEMANSRYLAQIDPKSIERIEILTGPQASTIYGSNAINGVMQIFTKRGATSHPQLTLNFLSGWVENNFSSALTPQHDYSTQLSGVEGRISYHAGTSWNYTGAWTPAKQTDGINTHGGARLELPTRSGLVTADVALRNGNTHNRQLGHQTQYVSSYRQIGWYTVSNSNGLAPQTTYTLSGQTLGVTLGFAPTSWWSHELGIGQDAEDVEQRATTSAYTQPFDTTLFLQQDHTARRSIHYTTTARLPMANLAQVTVTVGGDGWQNLTSSMNVSPTTLTGTLTGATSLTRQPGHNAGAFLQTQFGMADRLFLTYGLRAEWNPNFGEETQPNYAPRYGIALTQTLGTLTAKLRGSYGRSTRPPQSALKAAFTALQRYGARFVADYGNFDAYLANPGLAPEYQQGGEGGLELYLGNRSSLVVTRYNQTVDGLIALAKIDSVRSLVPFPGSGSDSPFDPAGYGYWYQNRYTNLGSIRNQGWELQGSVNTGPFITRGTYSWTKSRVIGVNPKYRMLFDAINYPQYQPGAIFQSLPEHIWAISVTYARAQTTASLNVSGAGYFPSRARDEFFHGNLISVIRLPQNKLRLSTTGYINSDRGYALADFNASHTLVSRVDGVFQVQNLTDHYANDYDAGYATIGRQVKLGVRWRL